MCLNHSRRKTVINDAALTTTAQSSVILILISDIVCHSFLGLVLLKPNLAVVNLVSKFLSAAFSVLRLSATPINTQRSDTTDVIGH